MSLDLESEEFDPVAALASACITLPCPDVPPLGNLAEYVNATKQLPQPSKRAATASVTKNLQRVNVFTEHRSRRRSKNVFTIMEEIQGPLSRLRDCMKDRTTVKVWIRRATEMRGVCTGYILAFDHHWNLIMSDVDETYVLKKNIKTLPLCGPATQIESGDVSATAELENPFTEDMGKLKLDASENEPEEKSEDQVPTADSSQKSESNPETERQSSTGSSKKSRPNKLELRQRHVHQLFIRGDNVAFISIL